jgi:hypothetical protein
MALTVRGAITVRTSIALVESANILPIFLRNNIMTMTDKYITISLNQAIQLRGVLNTSASDLREIVERHEKGYPFCGKLYHEYKAEQLKKFGKIIDKKIKSWQEKT